jgi:hypothetical protein
MFWKYHLNISGPSSRLGSHAGRHGGVGAASANFPLLFEKILLELKTLLYCGIFLPFPCKFTTLLEVFVVTLPLLKLQNDVHEALKSWYSTGAESSSLSYLQLYKQAHLKGTGNPRETTNSVLLEALEDLEVDFETEANLLRKRFLDGLPMHVAANQFNMSEANAYRKQKDALKQLALVLQTSEIRMSKERRMALERQLDLPFQVELVGVEHHLTQLSEVILLPESPWLICIDGLGGLGKTSLAHALIMHPAILDHFQQFAWVSAKQQALLPGTGLASTDSPALEVETLIDNLLIQLDHSVALASPLEQKHAVLNALLKKTSTLVVIDNLETMADYQTLLPTLLKLANPAKFLLTSRHSLRTYPDIFSWSLPELSQADVLCLLRQEAKTRGFTEMIQADDDQLQPIHHVVGGNPLALKLVVGQMSMLPLSQVLDNLKQAQGQITDELYTYIYWQDWHMLDDTSRHVFLMMPLANDGPLDQLEAVTKLDSAILSQALQQLVALSLVQVKGTLDDRRYILHRLTETFLLKEAIKWKTFS